jgi:hypothetical protein
LIVYMILFCIFARVRDAALDEFGQDIVGRFLNIACVYVDF